MGICVVVFGISTFSYINKSNDLTRIKLRLPKEEREVALLRERNKQLRYEISQFENPAHLMELAREFSHLRHPIVEEVLKVKEGLALGEAKKSKEIVFQKDE